MVVSGLQIPCCLTMRMEDRPSNTDVTHILSRSKVARVERQLHNRVNTPQIALLRVLRESRSIYDISASFDIQ